MASAASNSIVAAEPNFGRLSSNINGSASMATNIYSDDNDVEDLEMLLDAYFMQLEGTHNKILSVREYIDDTEDYVNIQLDNQRNELIQLLLMLILASFAIAVNTLIAGALAMNISCQLYDPKYKPVFFGRMFLDVPAHVKLCQMERVDWFLNEPCLRQCGRLNKGLSSV